MSSPPTSGWLYIEPPLAGREKTHVYVEYGQGRRRQQEDERDKVRRLSHRMLCTVVSQGAGGRRSQS